MLGVLFNLKEFLPTYVQAIAAIQAIIEACAAVTVLNDPSQTADRKF